MLTKQQNGLLLLARVLMASLFLWSGAEKIFDFRHAIGFAAHMGMPLAGPLMPLAILLELGCGLMILAGWNARIGAAVLALWMLVLGPWFHQFWHAPPALWQMMIDDFFHHFVMVGGMLYIVVFGPGDYAIKAA